MQQTPLSPNRTKLSPFLLWLSKAGAILILLLALLFWVNTSRVKAPEAEKSAMPAPLTPTAACGDPALTLGSESFPVQAIQPAATGSLPLPPDTAGVAYQVKETDPNFVFLFSPMPKNMTVMSTLTVGSTAKVTWSDCRSRTYRLSVPQQGSLDSLTSPDQSLAGITIFFETDISGVGFVFRGRLIEE